MNIEQLRAAGVGSVIALVVLVLAIILMVVGSLEVWPGALIAALAASRML